MPIVILVAQLRKFLHQNFGDADFLQRLAWQEWQIEKVSE
jgi:hypothetical protein